MSNDTHDQLRKVEEELHCLVEREFSNSSKELQDAGLRLELDPVHRSGSGSNYASFIEATLRLEDEDVQDIFYVEIAREGHLGKDRDGLVKWAKEQIAEIIDKRSES